MTVSRSILLFLAPCWIPAAATPPQDEAAPRAAVEWVRQLDDPETRERAAAALVVMGEPAVPVLLETLRAEHTDARKLEVLEVLRAMGPAAAQAADDVYGLLFELDGSLAIPLMQTAGELALYSEWKLMVFKLKPGRPRDGACAVEINDTPIPGGVPGGEMKRFLKALQRGIARSNARTHMAVSGVASRLDGAGGDLKECMLDFLILDPERLPEVVPILDGILRDESAEPVVRDKAARTALLVAGSDDDLTLAHARLLVHGRLAERKRAALRLREPDCRPRDVVPELVKALSDPDAEVLREVVVTLGIAQPSLEQAGPVLESLLSHPDRQVAERARAVLRRIREH